MDIRIDFDPLPWQSPLPGARFKAFVRGAQQVRLLELSSGFEEPDWCTRGHAGHVLEGSLTLRFPDGTERRLGAGDDIFIDETEAHKAVLGPDESARLLLFETIAPVAPAPGEPGAASERVAPSAFTRRLAPTRLTDPAVILIDVQPGFEDAIAKTGHGATLDLAPLRLRLEKLLVMTDCLELPTLATFERPDENGWLPEHLEAVWPAHGQRFVKQTYDCCDEPEIAQTIAGMGKSQLLVAGAETDVCVLQSVLSLLERGYEVFLLEDCLFTTEPYPAPAVRRMEAAGAVPCSLKTVFYELMNSVAAYDDPKALGSRWERLLPLFGEPENWLAWPPAGGGTGQS